MTRRPVSVLGTLLVCLWALPVSAQESAPTGNPPPIRPRTSRSSTALPCSSATAGRDAELLSMPLLAGDRLRTQDGRVEVLFADGSALHLDEHTTVDFQSDELVRLLDGRVRLSVLGPGARGRRIASTRRRPGCRSTARRVPRRRVLRRRDEVELAVLRGAAELVNDEGRSYVRAGERAYARAQAAPSYAYVFNSAAWDAFDRWSESRRDQRLGVSAQYLPDDVRRYSPAFDSYGSWRHEPAYGYVWYPRVAGRLASVLPRPLGRACGRTAGRGSAPIPGRGRRTLRPVGHLRRRRGSGFPGDRGRRRGCRGRMRRLRELVSARLEQPAGPRLLGRVTTADAATTPGTRGRCCRAVTSAPATCNVSRYQTVHVDPRLHGSFVVNQHGPAAHFAVNRSAVPIRTAGRIVGRARRRIQRRRRLRRPASRRGHRRSPRRRRSGCPAAGPCAGARPSTIAPSGARRHSAAVTTAARRHARGSRRSAYSNGSPASTTDSSRARRPARIVTPGVPDGLGARRSAAATRSSRRP